MRSKWIFLAIAVHTSFLSGCSGENTDTSASSDSASSENTNSGSLTGTELDAGMVNGPADPTEAVTSLPESVVSRLSLDTSFYENYLPVGNVPMLSSERVSPYALLEARWTIENMMANREDIIQTISDTPTRLVIMASDEFTTDVPEHSDLRPADYYDRRARGLGATDERPAMSVGAENILQLDGDPYSGESILIHEFAHVVHLQGMNNIDSDFNESLNTLYRQAMDERLWDDTYAATNAVEYFAEGVQSWFDANDENNTEHNEIDTREELMSYDPRLAAFLNQIFGDNPWQYAGPTDRQDELEHLVGFERESAGRFIWPERLADIDISSGPPVDTQLPAAPNVIAEDWTGIRSPTGQPASVLTFYNASSEELIIQWIDFEGQRVEYGRLSPGASHRQETFAGHLWEASRASDQTIVARFRAEIVQFLATID